jgi:hypothetical protein
VCTSTSGSRVSNEAGDPATKVAGCLLGLILADTEIFPQQIKPESLLNQAQPQTQSIPGIISRP